MLFCVFSCRQQEVAHRSCVLELLWDVFLWHGVGWIELFTALLCAAGHVANVHRDRIQPCSRRGKGGRLREVHLQANNVVL